MSAIKIENGRVSICISSILEAASSAEKRLLAEVLSCDDDIFDHVAAQIMETWTESGYRGAICCEAQATPQAGLDKAWRLVAKASSGIAAKEIKRLEDALAAQTQRYTDLSREFQELREKVGTP